MQQPDVSRNLSSVERCGGFDSYVLTLATFQCPGDDWLNNTLHGVNVDVSEQTPEASSNGTWHLGDYTIDSCWSETTGVAHCQLRFVPFILYTVIVCNAVKFLCMCIVAKYLSNLDEPILATIGDAVASFLDQPDATMKRLCLLSLQDLKIGVWNVSSPKRDYDPTY